MVNPRAYFRPKDMVEVLHLAAAENVHVTAGGVLTFGKLDIPYDTIVDLQGIADLNSIEHNTRENYARVGIACTLQQIVESPHVPDALKQSLTRAVPLNIRNGTTVYETIVYRTFPEWLAMLSVLNVALCETSLSLGERCWSMGLIVNGPHNKPPGEAEIPTALIIYPVGERQAVDAAYVARTPADQPIVNAAVSLKLNTDGRVQSLMTAVGGVRAYFPVVWREVQSVEGKIPSEINIPAVIDTVTSDLTMANDYLGSADYRREMARVMLRRALLDCLEQLS